MTDAADAIRQPGTPRASLPSVGSRPAALREATMPDIQIWDLWYPSAAAQGLPFARGRLDATDLLLVHAAPDDLDVEVRTDDGHLVARGKGLGRTADRPM